MWRNRIKEDEFYAFVIADADSVSEVWLRRFLVVLSTIILSLALDESLFVAWGFGYMLGDYTYLTYLKRKRLNIKWRNVVVAALLSASLGTWVGAMAIYMSWFQSGVFYFLGACIVVSQALHCLSSHARIGTALYVDLTIVALTTAGVTWATAAMTPQVNLSVGITVGGIAVLIYFIHSVRRTVMEREALRRRTEAELQDQKMNALGQFTSGVAHDFNNMLTVISGNIELAKLEPLPGDAQNLLTEAEKAAGNAASLVRQLLAYSRKSTLQIELWEANDVLGRVASVASRLLPETVSFRFLPTSRPIHVRADGPMLETALLNLILNARDALGDRPGMIVLNTMRSADGTGVSIAVTDDGPGMSPDILNKATDPFFTTKAFGKGSGLGLSMVAGFCEQSGGYLRLENLTPRGLSAQIYLPIVRPETAEKTGDHAAPPKTSTAAGAP